MATIHKVKHPDEHIEVGLPPHGSTVVEGDGFRVVVYTSPNDGAPVVEVDTEEDLGEIRVYLNDGQIFAGNPEE